MSYYYVNLFDILPMSKERFTALEEWIRARGCKLAISVNNDAAPLDSEFQKDFDEESELQGVNARNLLTMQRQAGGGL